MSWLVVGGKGQLGLALSEALSSRGIDFHAWGRNDLDIRLETSCLKNINSLSPNVIVNAAAWTEVDEAETNPVIAHEINANGALNLAKAAKSVAATFVQISTDYVFSENTTFPWKEDDSMCPMSVYGASKAAGKIAVKSAYPENSYIIRTAWLYSRWGKNFAKTMTRLALSDDADVNVVNDQIGQPTFALDLADQIIDSVTAKLSPGVYHGTNAGQSSWFDFAKEIFFLVNGSSDRVIPINSSTLRRPAQRPTYSVLSHDGWGELV
jgi:dTDP-4-dehydrorhamnose reductase